MRGVADLRRSVQYAGNGGGDFGFHLHRLEYDDRLVFLNVRAVIGEPADDRAGDGRFDRGVLGACDIRVCGGLRARSCWNGLG